jgi:hypothetical protein
LRSIFRNPKLRKDQSLFASAHRGQKFQGRIKPVSFIIEYRIPYRYAACARAFYARSNPRPGVPLSLRAQRSNLHPGAQSRLLRCAPNCWGSSHTSRVLPGGQGKCHCEECSLRRSNLHPGVPLSLRAQRSNLHPGVKNRLLQPGWNIPAVSYQVKNPGRNQACIDSDPSPHLAA